MAVYTTGIGSSRKSSQTAQEKKQKEEEEKKKKEEEARKQQQQYMQQLQKAAAKEASSKKKKASSNGGKTSTVRANERATGDWEHDSAVVQSRLAPYSRANLSRQNARQQKTESYMDLTTANEPKARAGIEMYKARSDAQKYAEMNKVGYRNYDQDSVNRSVKGYEESYQRWKKVYDANKGTAATDPKTERQGQIKAQAQKIQRYTDTGTRGKDAQEDDKRWAGVTYNLKRLGKEQRYVDTPGAARTWNERHQANGIRESYQEAYNKAFPSKQEEQKKEQTVSDRYTDANAKLRAAERDAYYWNQAAQDAAWFGDAERFTRSLPHIVESARKVQGALPQYRQASDELAGAVRDEDEKLKQGDLATWYARNLTDDEIRRRLEEEKSRDVSVTDRDRAENPGMYPDAAFRTMPRQASFDPTMNAGEAPGNRYYMTEQERQLTEQSDRELLQRKVDDREVQVTALQRALESHHVNDLEDRITWHAGRGELPAMVQAGREAFARDASGEGSAGRGVTFADLANGTVSAEAMAQGNAAGALATIGRNLLKCTDQQKEYVYAMYAIDPQGAVELSQKYYDEAMDEYYAKFYKWANADSGWQGGRRAAAAVLGVGAKLISGLDPFGESGQDLSRTGEAFISGGAASASRNGLFGIEALGGDESPISSSIPYIGRGRAGEAYQLGTSVLESAGIAVPAMLMGRYDTAAAKVAGLIGTTLMGSSAAADDYRECLSLGMSDDQAKWHATAAGVAEAAFEYISLDKLIDPDNIRHGLLRMLTQGGIEASEEVCTTIANRISDTLIADFYGTKNEIERQALEYELHGMSAEEAEQKAQNQWLAGLMMDGLGGLFSGIIMGGGSDILQRGIARLNTTINTAEENTGRGYLTALETAGYTDTDTLDALAGYARDNRIDVRGLTEAQAKAAETGIQAPSPQAEGIGTETDPSTASRSPSPVTSDRGGLDVGRGTETETRDAGRETADDGRRAESARPTETQNTETQNTENAAAETGENAKNAEKPKLSKRDLRRAGKVRSQIVDSISTQFEGKTAAEQAAVYDSLVEQYGSGIEAVASEALYNESRKAMQSARSVPTLEQQHGTDAEAFQSETAQQAVARAYRDAQSAIMRDTGDTTQSSVRSLQAATKRAGDGLTMQAEIEGADGRTQTVDITGWNQNGTKVVLKDGTQVSVDSLQADENTKSFLQAMEKAKLGSYADEAFRTYLNSGARSLADGYSWIMGYRNAFGVGEVKGSVTTAVQQAARYGVDMETAAAAYYNGVMAVEAGNAQRAATVQRAIVKAGKAGVSGKTAVIDNSRINWDGLSREQKNQKKFLDKVAQAYGADVVWFDSSEGGKLGAMQGKYQDGKIWLDVNAGKNAVSDAAVAIVGTMGHEMTHMMQDYSAELYQEYCDFALDAIRSVEGEAGLERMIRDRIDNRLRNIENGSPLKEMSREEAIDEVVARFSEKIFSREESMQTRLKDLQENHKDLWQKIKDFFKGWLDKVRQMLQQDTGITKKELQAWDKLSEEIQKQLAEKWGEGAADMARNLDLTEGVKLSDVKATENAATEGGTIQFSEREIIGADGTNYGIGVYMDSALLSGLTEDERVEMFREYLDEISGQSFDAIDKYNSPVKVNIAAKGRRYTDHHGRTVLANDDLRQKHKKSHTKQEAIALIDEVLRNAQYKDEAPAKHSHEWLDDNGKNPWQGWRTYMQEPNGTVYEAILHITTADNGELFLYDITPKKIQEAGQSGSSDTGPNLSGEQSGNSDTDLSKTKIAQTEVSVNPQNSEGRLSERDTEYLELAKDPEKNREKLQEMVDEAAKAAGYTIRAYHGTTEEFNAFNGGAFFTDDFFNADGYASGERVIDAYLKIDNPLVIDANGAKWDELSTPRGNSTRDVVGQLSNEYDGVIFQNIADSWMDDADAGESTVYYVRDSSQAKESSPVTYDDSGNVIPLSERFNTENEDIRYSEREADMPADVDLVMQMDEKDADTPEGKALIREAQAKQKQIEALQKKLAEAKRQLTTTKRTLNTRWIGNVAGNVIRDFGISDAGGKNIKQQATAILTEAYQKALDQIDSGATAADAWSTVYYGAIEAAELLIDQGRYTENNNGKWTNVPYSQYIGEDRQLVIDQMVSEAAKDFVANRYRAAVKETAADRLVARTEKRMQGKIDEARAKSAELKAANEKLEQDNAFLKEQAEDAQFVAGNLYDQVKDLRQELKDNRKLTVQERKSLQGKIDRLNRQIEAKRTEAAAWRDRANRNASLLKSALESKSRDIQTVKDESQRQVDRAVAEKEAVVRKLEAQIEREQRILAGKLKPPAMQKMLKEARETAAAEIMEKKNAQIERMREGREAGALRSRIKNLHAEMQRTLLKPKEGHYVPQDLVRPVIDLLEMIDSNKLPQDIENLQKRIDAEKNPDKREALEERMITLKDRQEKASVKINAISAAYARMKGNENTGIYYDESVEAMLLKLGETVKGKTIYEMNSDELSDVFTVMKAMNTTIRNAVKADLVEKGRNIFEIGTSMIDELRNSKGAHRLQMLESWHKSQLSPLRAFKRFGGYMPNSTWLKMYDMLNNAQNQTMWLEMQGTRIFDDVLGTKADRKLAEKLSSTDEKDMVDVGLKDVRGNSVKITRGMMLSLYMHMQNEDNMRHIMYGGISLPGMKQYYGKKSGDAWGSAKTRIPALGVRVSNLEQLLETLGEEGVNNAYKEQEQAVREMFDSVRQKIEKILTPYDRRWIAASKKFFDDFSRRELNKATMAMYGFNKASVDNYFPITSDPAFLKTDIDSIKRDASLENAGFMKARVKAGNPILLEDITKAVNRQITKVAQYAGMTQALKTFDNVYKVQQKGYADSVKEALRDKFEAPGQKYVENLLSDLVGGRSQESTLFDKIKGHYAQAVLSVNAPVTVKQAASFPTALPVVGWKALAKALAAGGKSHLPISRADRALIDTYTPLLWKRAQGAIDVELGDVAKGRDWTQKASWLMGWIQKTDLATVGRLWSAAEYYVRDNFKSLEKGTTEQIKKGESEYYRKVAEIFNRIVEETQPNYSVMQRPDILRNPNKLLRAVTMFSTQRLQNANILIDALGEYNAMRAWDKNVKTEESKAARKTARVNLVNAIASQAISTVVLNLMTFAGGALLHRMNPWRDDDDELTMEGIREEFLDGILSTFSGSFLWGSDAYDALHALLTDEKYYKGDVGGVSTMYDFIDSTVKSGKALIKLLKKDDKSWEDAKNLAHGQLYKTAEYLSQMAGVPLGNIKKILDGAYYHGVDILNKEFFSFEAGLKRANSTNARRFTKAWNAKDEAKMDKVLDEMFGNKVRTSDAAEGARDALSAAAKEAYQAGKMDMEEYVAFLKRPECFTDKGITSRITDRLKEDFIAGKRSAEETVELLLKYKDYKKNPEQSAWSAVKEWAAKAEFEKENGEDADDDDFSFSQYDELNDAVAADENVTAEIQELKAHGYTDKQINDALQDSIKKAFKDGTYTEEEAIDALVRYGATYSQNGKTVAFDKDKAWQTVREWAAKAGHEDEEGHLEEGYSYSLYDGLREAVTTGKGIEAAMKELTDHGVKASAVNDELNKTVLKLYTDGTITEKTAIGLLTKYHTVTKNKQTRLQTADEAWAALREASAKAAHTDEDGHLEDDYSYNKYEKIDAALDKNGDISKLVKELTDHGEKQENITKHIKTYLLDRYVAGQTTEKALKNQLSRYCGITKTDEVEKILKDANCEKDCGYGFSEVKSAYGRGDLSEATAKKMLRKYGGLTESGAAHRIGYWDYCKKNPDTKVSDSGWDSYYDKTLPTIGGTLSSRGMKQSKFTEYLERRANLEITDLDGDGKRDNKAYIVGLIDSLNISSAEKDMLYYYNGYSAKEKPRWH